MDRGWGELDQNGGRLCGRGVAEGVAGWVEIGDVWVNGGLGGLVVVVLYDHGLVGRVGGGFSPPYPGCRLADRAGVSVHKQSEYRQLSALLVPARRRLLLIVCVVHPVAGFQLRAVTPSSPNTHFIWPLITKIQAGVVASCRVTQSCISTKRPPAIKPTVLQDMM